MYGEFYYTRLHVDQPKKEGEKPTLHKLICSFPLDYVEQTIGTPSGERIVILKNGHEESRIYDKQAKNGKVEEMRVREWVRSEIVLNPEDAERYRMVTEVVHINLKKYENEPLSPIPPPPGQNDLLIGENSTL